MANTWPGMNSGGLAVGPWAQKRRGEERRGGEGRRWEEFRVSPLWLPPTRPALCS